MPLPPELEELELDDDELDDEELLDEEELELFELLDEDELLDELLELDEELDEDEVVPPEQAAPVTTTSASTPSGDVPCRPKAADWPGAIVPFQLRLLAL